MKQRIYWKIVITLLAVSLGMNLIAFHTGFCDWYTDHIYGSIANVFGRLTAPLPFALGEWMIYFGILLVLFGVILAVVRVIFRKRPRIRWFARGYYKSLLMVAVCMIFVYTFTWLIPIRGSLLGQNCSAGGAYSIQDVLELRNYFVREMNASAETISRGDTLHIPTFAEAVEANAAVVQSMQQMAAEYPRLAGYYPPPKAAFCSDVLEWMGISGMTISCTTEILVNKYCMISLLYAPLLYAHESAHHHGYYKESEAEFLAFLACLRSDSPAARYGAQIYLYFALDEAYQAAVAAGGAASGEVLEPSALVLADIRCGQAAFEEAYAADDHPLEDFSDTLQSISDVGWETQAAVLQEYNYDGVVALLLQSFSDLTGAE